MEDNKDYSYFEGGGTLWSIMDTAIDAIVIIDNRGLIQVVNKAVNDMFGYSKEELLYKNVSVLMPSPDKERHDGYIDNYKRTSKPQIIGKGREVSARHKNGKIFPVRLAVSEVTIKDQVFFTGILHDLTAQKNAEDELLRLAHRLEDEVHKRTEELSEVVNRLLKVNKKYQDEIAERIEIENVLKQKEEALKSLLDKEKQINQMKSRFVSMASHEFRTPLATVLSSASLIERYERTDQHPKRQRHVQKIKSAVNNLTNILNDFLSLGKLEEGNIASKPEEIQVEKLCKDIFEDMEGLLKLGQKMDYSIDTTIHSFVSDPRFLSNGIMNMLSNAIKYSDTGKTIGLYVSDEDGYLKFEVRDEGIGIPKEEQEQIFTRFFRAQNATNIQGTGLGLHIVKRYTDLLGGKVDFISEYGKGSSFFIYVPIDKS